MRCTTGSDSTPFRRVSVRQLRTPPWTATGSDIFDGVRRCALHASTGSDSTPLWRVSVRQLRTPPKSEHCRRPQHSLQSSGALPSPLKALPEAWRTDPWAYLAAIEAGLSRDSRRRPTRAPCPSTYLIRTLVFIFTPSKAPPRGETRSAASTTAGSRSRKHTKNYPGGEAAPSPHGHGSVRPSVSASAAFGAQYSSSSVAFVFGSIGEYAPPRLGTCEGQRPHVEVRGEETSRPRVRETFTVASRRRRAKPWRRGGVAQWRRGGVAQWRRGGVGTRAPSSRRTKQRQDPLTRPRTIRPPRRRKESTRRRRRNKGRGETAKRRKNNVRRSDAKNNVRAGAAPPRRAAPPPARAPTRSRRAAAPGTFRRIAPLSAWRRATRRTPQTPARAAGAAGTPAATRGAGSRKTRAAGRSSRRRRRLSPTRSASPLPFGRAPRGARSPATRRPPARRDSRASSCRRSSSGPPRTSTGRRPRTRLFASGRCGTRAGGASTWERRVAATPRLRRG